MSSQDLRSNDLRSTNSKSQGDRKLVDSSKTMRNEWKEMREQNERYRQSVSTRYGCHSRETWERPEERLVVLGILLFFLLIIIWCQIPWEFPSRILSWHSCLSHDDDHQHPHRFLDIIIMRQVMMIIILIDSETTEDTTVHSSSLSFYSNIQSLTLTHFYQKMLRNVIKGLQPQMKTRVLFKSPFSVN